jgi:hypothetical protein
MTQGSRARSLARLTGLDGNPLRRRTDKIATCLAAQLLAAFLAGAPLLGIAAFTWAGRAAAAEQRAERSWHQVQAVLLKAAVAPAPTVGGTFGYSWVPAQWIGPRGRLHHGEIPVGAALAAGRKVWIWVNTRGSPTDVPLTQRAVVARAVAAAAIAPVALLILLACLASAGRWLLDRRRLAAWETAWAVVGPQWTRRFRSRD